ncbi:DnaT-like ssDNA-binding domain-containing protein [Citrobacter sedlakii]|uniref:DnaT-like ssDNA-binding domain-containing protein n=1 Tax=Citrobacter sedlakii TaxID=67826 RepID=UPI0022B331C2|nr:DnaT-like ssDNA-binding domain-containing protein [Citrobacter sedlakii]MCZ4677286.1 DnaT-like ssDNA-binding domain-containing protein [Citrobacter sedlakii]MDR5007343.1 DnaT-like ssDNA-binding domain-containing protein [Citrobacter sedlakii]
MSPNKPEIYHLAERLSLDPDAVLGKLIRLWVWADQQTIDGNANCNAVSVTKNAIDRITFATGFADALISVGWLTESDGKLSIPNFERHNGESSKKRALTNKRVTKVREKSKKCNAASVTESDQKALPEEEEDNKYINPTHNARVRESAPTSQSGSTQQPVVTKPEYLGDLNEPIGKFSMTADWHPSLDFRRRAALWGVALPEPEFTPAELTAFRDYWASEGKVFTQIQWEQKFARHVNHVRAKAKPASRGENHAGIQPDSTASRAVQQIRAAREEWERRNGIVSVGDDLETLGSHGGDLLESLDPEERDRTL